jgi:hypothetical protein
MAWGAIAGAAVGGLGSLLSRGKKVPDLSSLSREDRKKYLNAAMEFLQERMDKGYLFSPGDIAALLGPSIARNAANFLSGVRSTTEASLASGQGARSGTLAANLAALARSRLAADRLSAAELRGQEAQMLPMIQQSSAEALQRGVQNDANLAVGAAAQNAQRPSALGAFLTGAARGASQGAALQNAFGGGGGGGALFGASGAPTNYGYGSGGQPIYSDSAGGYAWTMPKSPFLPDGSRGFKS